MPETLDDPQAGTDPKVEAPPWGSDEQFDPAKAWKLIEDLRSDKAKLSSRPVLDDDAARKLAEYDRLEQASKTDLQRATEELTRWQAETEKWRTTSVANRIEALAGQDFADPSDAATAIGDPARFISSGGVIDEAAIKAELAGVLEKKPHWRRQETSTGPRLPAPNTAQGRNGAAAPSKEAVFASFMQGL
jgi:hypothetical protein